MPVEVMTNDIGHIAVEGVIGAGKTSLTLKLAKLLKGRAVLEKFEENRDQRKREVETVAERGYLGR